MDVETRTMIEFQALSARQALKSIEKYGHPIDLAEDRDWYTMAMEELVDLAKYLTALKMQMEGLASVPPNMVAGNIEKAQSAGSATREDLDKARSPWQAFWERHGVQDAS